MNGLSKNVQKVKGSIYVERFLFFGRNSGIHGLRYITQENASIFSRLVWILVLVTSSWCTYMLLLPVILRGSEVSFTPETAYLSWTTKFPAVTVCEKYIHAKTLRRFTELYPDLITPLDFTRRKYLTDLLYAKGACSKCEPCGEKIPCDLPWRAIANKVRRNCEQMITDCACNGQKFKCCDIFSLVDSEEGPCYSMNTLQSPKVSAVTQFVVNRTTGPGVLSFKPLVDIKISVHSTEELSTNALDSTFKFEANPLENTEYIFSIAEVENDPLLERETIAVRGCRYLKEIPEWYFMSAYPVYSYGGCTLSSETQRRYTHCGCVHPVRDVTYKSLYCNFTGLNCLVQYEAKIAKLSGPTSEGEDMKDACLPACQESELKQVHLSKSVVADLSKDGARVIIRMSSLPTLRYRRNVLRNDLDLVVSVGGIAGLFFGASILSFVEVLYLLFMKS